MKPHKIASASLLLALFAWPVGCLQVTGVQDYKVEETPAQCKLEPGADCMVATGCWCADGESCYLTDASGAGKCGAAGSVGQGGACTKQVECAARLLCVESGCQPVCAKNEDCPSKNCQGVALSDGTVVANTGYCLP